MSKGVKVTRDDARQLWDALNRNPDQFTPAPELPLSAVKIRACCSEWPEHFISGRKGYKLAVRATDEEIEYSIHDLRSRCRSMLGRARKLQKLLVKRHHGRPDLAGN